MREIKKLVKTHHYNIVHCHTPVSAACTRLACKRLRSHGVHVIYTAHGFHFYNSAPLKNWLLFYPIEKHCAHWTDLIITINQEDHARALRRLHAKRVEYVPGVGIDLTKFRDTVVDKSAKRASLGIPDDAFILLSVGELNQNKNHALVIDALKKLDDPGIYLIIAGTGETADNLLASAKALGDRVQLLGYRNDIAELYQVSDALIHPSLREGLSVSIMEAMAAGLPIIASDIRGNQDLVDPSVGYLCDPHDRDSFVDAIQQIRSADTSEMEKNAVKAASQYAYDKINPLMLTLYHEIANENR